MKIRKMLGIMLVASLIMNSIQIPAFAGTSGLGENAAAVRLEEKTTETLPEEIVLTAKTADGITVTMKAETSAFVSAKTASPSNAEEADTEDSADPEASDGGIHAADFDPALLELKADTVSETEEKEAEKALESETGDENIARRTTYDIYVLYNGKKIEPLPGKKAEVSFTLPETPSGADEVRVYHHTEEGVEKLIEEKLGETAGSRAAYETEKADESGEQPAGAEEANGESAKKADEASAENVSDHKADGAEAETGGAAYDVLVITGETDSFSFYTIDFTYNEKTVSIPGDTMRNLLADILEDVGIEGQILEAKAYQDTECKIPAENGIVKNENGDALFKIYEENGVWYADAIHSFETEHGLYVKTENAEYKIRVTDPAGYVCKIGTTEYMYIADALEASHEGESAENPTTITLIANDEENVVIPGDDPATTGVDETRFIELDLNGYVIKSAADGKPVITIGTSNSSSAKLTLKDSAPTATHSDDYAALPAGGVITGAENGVTNGGGVCNKGTFVMCGGSVYGNKTAGACTGAGVYNQGSFTLSGGSISNNTTAHGDGGGVSNKGNEFGSSFTMTGGKISGNSAGTDKTGGTGGGIYNESSLEIIGGEISGNNAYTFGDGVDFSGGTMTVGGSAVIKGNTSGKDSRKADNLYIGTGYYVSVATGDKAPVTDKMEIGVTLGSVTGKVTNACDAEDYVFFRSDNTNYGVYNQAENSNNYVYIGSPVKMFKTGDDPSTGTIYGSVNKAVRAADDKSFSEATVQMLSDSVENLDFSSPGFDNCTDITLDLNGHVLKSSSKGSSVINIGEGKTVTIKDSNPEATHSGDYAALPAGGVITGAAANGGYFKFAGGGVCNGGTFNMYGGTITGNDVGTNTSSAGGGVYNNGTMTVGGTAVITGNKCKSSESNLYLSSGKTVAIGTKTGDTDETKGNGVPVPAEGMAIGVTTADAPAAGNPVAITSNGAQTDVQYFISDSKEYSVKYNTDHLELFVKTVCKIGTTEYKSIADALAAAHGGENTGNPTTITLIADDKENVTIPGDDTATTTVNETRFIILDLNGYVLQGTGSGRVISNSGTLTIQDSNKTKTHYFKYSKSSAWVLYDDADEAARQSAIGLDAITEETADSTLIKVAGGCITGGNSGTNHGGGILVDASSRFTMTGGSICGNQAAQGGGLYTGSNTTVSLSNVTIAGNYATSNVGGMMFNGDTNNNYTPSLTIGGAVRITENTSPKDKNLTLWTAKTPLAIGSSIAGSRIGVTIRTSDSLTTAGAFTTSSNATEADAAYFSSDASGYAVVYKADTDTTGHLELAKSYTVTLNGNEATTAGSVTSVTAINGSAMPAITGEGSLPARTGHTFAGYFDAQTGGNKYYNADGTSAKAWDKTADTTLYAQWTHVHGNWKYSASGSVLTAACQNPNCTNPVFAVSITIEASGKGYDGKVREASITDTDKKWTSAGLSLPEIKYFKEGEAAALSGAPKAAGVYTAKITAGEAAASCNFTISPKQLTISGTKADKTYDGTNAAAVTAGTVTGICDGDEVTVSGTGSFTDADAGTQKTVAVTYTLKGAQKDNYTAPQPENVIAKISKRAITLTSGSATKAYDGTPLTKNEVTDKLTGATDQAGFVAGEGANYQVTGSRTVKGTSKNTFTYTLKAGTKADNYTITTEQGDLIVTSKATAIVITASSDTKMYDGTALTNGGYTYTSGVLQDGDVLTAVVEGTVTDAGTAANRVSSYKVMRGETDVTASYTFGTPVDGKLAVTKRAITLTSGSATKAYDGTPLTKNEVTDKLTGTTDQAGFVAGEGANYDVTGSRTEEGSSGNTFTYTLKAGTKADNYTITKEEGVLKVLEADQCTVTFDMNGHGTQVPAQIVAKNGYVTEPEAPAEEGWIFQGWFKESTLQTVWNFASDVVTKATKLFAKWLPGDYTVTFDRTDIEPVTAKNGETIELPAVTETGKTFAGWYVEGDGKYYTGSYVVSGDVFFHAAFRTEKKVEGKNIGIDTVSRKAETEITPADEKEAAALKEVLENRSVLKAPTGLAEAVKTESLKNFLQQDPDATDLIFGLNVELTEFSGFTTESSSQQKLTYRAEPWVRVKTNNTISAQTPVANSDLDGKKISFRLAIPASVDTNGKVAEIEHRDGTTGELIETIQTQIWTETVDGKEENFTEVTVTRFSTFTMTFVNRRTDNDDTDYEESPWYAGCENGWAKQPGTADWYYIQNHTLKKGWHLDAEDRYWYYLDPVTGKMHTGWTQVNGRWYYLNPYTPEQTWFLGTDGKWHYDAKTASRPLGSMYCDEKTPDGYRVDENGAYVKEE